MIVQGLEVEVDTTLGKIPFGAIFLFDNTLFMRVKPVGWMLNSTIFQEKLGDGYAVVVNIETGQLKFLKGTEKVELTSSTISWNP